MQEITIDISLPDMQHLLFSRAPNVHVCFLLPPEGCCKVNAPSEAHGWNSSKGNIRIYHPQVDPVNWCQCLAFWQRNANWPAKKRHKIMSWAKVERRLQPWIPRTCGLFDGEAVCREIWFDIGKLWRCTLRSSAKNHAGAPKNLSPQKAHHKPSNPKISMWNSMTMPLAHAAKSPSHQFLLLGTSTSPEKIQGESWGNPPRWHGKKWGFPKMGDITQKCLDENHGKSHEKNGWWLGVPPFWG